MSTFDNMGGQTPAFSKITGLAPVRVLAVNPTDEKYEELTGNKPPYELKYELRQNQFADNREERPISFLIHQEEFDVYQLVTVNMADTEVETKTGKKMWFDKRGNFTYYADSVDIPLNNPKMNWANYDAESMRAVRVGETTLYSILIALARVNTNSKDSNIREVVEGAGATFENLYAGNVQALNDFISWIYKKNPETKIVIPFVINEKIADDGSKKFIQQALVRDSLIFQSSAAGGVLDSSVISFKEQQKEAQENGKDITSKYFTYDLMEFDIDKCVNGNTEEPTDVATEVDDDDWLKED